MNRSIKNLTSEELKKLLKQETRAFLDGLDKGITAQELQEIRTKMKEISETLEEKAKQRENPE